MSTVFICNSLVVAFSTIVLPLCSLPVLAQQSAQQSDEVLEVDPDDEDASLRLTVTGEILDRPVYAPFRREGTVRESSQPVYVIDRDQIEAQGARTVDEALRYLPGVLSEGTTGGQLGALSGQFVRGGTSAQTLILLDGRPLNEVGSSGAFDLSTITTEAVEQIEVLPGGGSVLYGSNAIGGVINIITRRPLAESGIETTATVEAGSFGYNQQSMQLQQRVADSSLLLSYSRTAAKNDFPFSLRSTDFEGTRTNAEVLYNNLNLQLSGDLGDRNRLRFGVLYLSKDLGVPGGFPVPDSLAGGFNALTADDQQFTENWLLDLAYEADLGQADDSLLTARLYADFSDFRFSDPVADNAFESPSQRDTDQTSLGAQIQHDWQFADGQNLTYGLDYRTVTAENSTLDLLSNARTQNYRDTINQLGLFSRYQLDITPRISTNLGIRQDFNDLAAGSFTSFNVGSQIRLTDTTNLRANFARNFRVPTLGDLFFEPFNNPDLQPERGLSFDVGLDQSLGDRGLWRFSFYRNDIRDAISFDLESSTPQNIGRVESIGIETTLNYQLFDDLFAFANYTWNRPKIREGPTPENADNLLPFTHANSFNAGLAYEANGLYVALLTHSVSNVFVDRGNQESLGGHTTFDFKLRVPLGESFAINASVDNIFDAQYEEFPGFPGVGRSFQAGIRGAF
ncbi:TonB-dependent siderophore receptor [cf. Phormidesmis sp. LEGE 11477]|uniref:TonB-dependent receptor plug domain-containing protein n=1 Tax=cf. Phormidesmis sp. LEGE 11477 TaxID=1828680 RepID=UPI00187F1925|nr:TonB-dependent receptor [cf. Phormidesmis sp. LEGE 11477]MBE9064127.1 TonB-dependent receptor [cf. Phormidesmis sp. LEGE 11477]